LSQPVINSVGTIREKSKKSESDSFAPAGKTQIDSDLIPGPTSPKNTKKRLTLKQKRRSKVKTLTIGRKNLNLSKASR
jgi:hypothetical protein